MKVESGQLKDNDSATAALLWQRAVSERLLLSAVRGMESTQVAEESSARAAFLAAATRELTLSLDEATTRSAVRSRALPRVGSWCIVDVIEPNGELHRLPAIHPDSERRALALRLEG